MSAPKAQVGKAKKAGGAKKGAEKKAEEKKVEEKKVEEKKVGEKGKKPYTPKAEVRAQRRGAKEQKNKEWFESEFQDVLKGVDREEISDLINIDELRDGGKKRKKDDEEEEEEEVKEEEVKEEERKVPGWEKRLVKRKEDMVKKLTKKQQEHRENEKRGREKRLKMMERAEEEEGEEGEGAAEEEYGVIYIGHLPYGFFEPQLAEFFGQFGVVDSVLLARSRKTKNSKGFGFIKFRTSEVAEIAADTMNDYLLFKKRLVCTVVPRERAQNIVWPMGDPENIDTLYADHPAFEAMPHIPGPVLKPVHVKIPRSNKMTLSDLKRKQDAKMKQLQKLGIDYNFEGYKNIVNKYKNAKSNQTTTKKQEKTLETQ